LAPQDASHCRQASTHLDVAVQHVAHNAANILVRLDPRQFVRIHRSSIVKVSRVVEFRRVADDEYLAVLSDGAIRPVSESGWRRLELAIGSAT
jgi:DNA-binding LytR/AlgR family response regulator